MGESYWIVFNLLMLKFAGNTGVAAYGIIANLALVALAFLIGLSQGTQPLISRFFGQGQYKEVRRVYRYAVVTAVVIGVVVIAIVYGFTDELIRVFNSSRDPELARIAGGGIHLYFTGFLIVGINMSLLTVRVYRSPESVSWDCVAAGNHWHCAAGPAFCPRCSGRQVCGLRSLVQRQ